LALIMLLCLFVVVQMLGVPVTLLSPVEAADTLAAPVLEGFSVPPPVPKLTLSGQAESVLDSQPSVHTPVLASALFHPPVL
jgi:hypothetical protein